MPEYLVIIKRTHDIFERYIVEAESVIELRLMMNSRNISDVIELPHGSIHNKIIEEAFKAGGEAARHDDAVEETKLFEIDELIGVIKNDE